MENLRLDELRLDGRLKRRLDEISALLVRIRLGETPPRCKRIRSNERIPALVGASKFRLGADLARLNEFGKFPRDERRSPVAGVDCLPPVQQHCISTF